MSNEAVDYYEKTLLSAATAPAIGEWKKGEARLAKSFAAKLEGSGAIQAVIEIDVSCNGSDALLLATITLNGNNKVIEGFTREYSYEFTRARLVSISGTNAAVNVLMEL